MFPVQRELAVDLGNNAGTYGSATLTDSETQTLFDCDRSDELNVHNYVIARHAHFLVSRQCDYAGNVGSSEEELRTVVGNERSMTAALFLLKNVNLTSELGVRVDRTGLAQNLTTLDIGTV